MRIRLILLMLFLKRGGQVVVDSFEVVWKPLCDRLEHLVVPAERLLGESNFWLCTKAWGVRAGWRDRV